MALPELDAIDVHDQNLPAVEATLAEVLEALLTGVDELTAGIY